MHAHDPTAVHLCDEHCGRAPIRPRHLFGPLNDQESLARLHQREECILQQHRLADARIDTLISQAKHGAADGRSAGGRQGKARRRDGGASPPRADGSLPGSQRPSARLRSLATQALARVGSDAHRAEVAQLSALITPAPLLDLSLNRALGAVGFRIYADAVDSFRLARRGLIREKEQPAHSADDRRHQRYAQRVLLCEMVRSLQWRTTIEGLLEERKRLILAQVRRTLTVCIVAVVTVMALLVGWLPPESWMPTHVLVVAFVICCGGLGAAASAWFGIGKRLSRSVSLDDVRRLTLEGGQILGRCRYGAAAALTAYFIMLSGLLGGALFPFSASQGTGGGGAAETLSHQALLTVGFWSIVAGVSETFVPRIVSRARTVIGDRRQPEDRGG